MKDSNMTNENVRVATLKLTRWVDIVIKDSDEELVNTDYQIDDEYGYPDEALKYALEEQVGENNAYIEDMLPEYNVEIISERQVDKEWLKKKSVNYIEEGLKDVVKESGFFDDAEKEAA